MRGMLFCFLVAGASALAARPAGAVETGSGTIAGVVLHAETGERIADALVVLQCTCLAAPVEAKTNEQGQYAFRGLPPGTFTIQVLTGQADMSKVTTLSTGAKFRANFRVDPQNTFRRTVSVVQEFIEPAPTFESAYTIDGASVNTPSFGVTSGGGEPRQSAKERLREYREQSIELREIEASATAAPERTRVQLAAPMPEVEQQQATKPLPDDYARQVVYSGAMDVAVYDVAKSKEKIEALVVKAGGYVQSLRGDGMLLRIPAEDFRQVATKIGKLGRVDRQDFEALDITEDYYDLHMRIDVLRRTQRQLLELLDKARTVEQALDVRRELDKVTLELEALLGRERVLASQVRFSALSLALTKRIPQTDTPSTNDPFPWVDEIGVEGTAWR